MAGPKGLCLPLAAPPRLGPRPPVRNGVRSQSRGAGRCPLERPSLLRRKQRPRRPGRRRRDGQGGRPKSMATCTARSRAKPSPSRPARGSRRAMRPCATVSQVGCACLRPRTRRANRQGATLEAARLPSCRRCHNRRVFLVPGLRPHRRVLAPGCEYWEGSPVAAREASPRVPDLAREPAHGHPGHRPPPAPTRRSSSHQASNGAWPWSSGIQWMPSAHSVVCGTRGQSWQ